MSPFLEVLRSHLLFSMHALSDGILKLLIRQGIDSTESIPAACEAWRAGTTTLFLTRFLAKIPALGSV
jgi:hypothetical protein